MAINKVVYGNDTLIDLTNDTATEDDVLEGVTFHDKSGSLRSGSLKPVLDVEVDGNSIVDQDGVANITSDNLSVIAKDLTENKTATVTDGVADFETIDGSLVKSLVVEIEPSQSGSGTPSPSNIRPISGYTQEDVFVVGKNLINWNVCPFNENKLEVTLDAGTYTLSGKSTINDGNAYIRGQKANGTYCTKAELGFPTWGDSTTPNVYYGGAGNQTFTITIPEDGVRLEFGKLNNDGTIPAQLEKGSTATPYEPYHGKTYTTPFNQTVYGGTLDVLTGELTIDRGYIKKKWSEFADRGTLTNNERKDVALAERAKYPPTTSKPQISNLLPCIVQYNLDSPHFYCNDTTAIVFLPIGTDGNTEIEIVYELATPIIIQLAPQKVKSLVGENHISASTGDVTECKYSMLINGDDLEMLLS